MKNGWSGLIAVMRSMYSIASSAIAVTRFQLGLPTYGYIAVVLRKRFGCLIGVTTDEAIEIVKAHTCRPLVEGPGLAGLEFRSVVVLAEPGRPVAVILEDLSDRRLVPSHDAVVARIACRLLGHDAEAHRMM